jgi:hypothetical protein
MSLLHALPQLQTAARSAVPHAETLLLMMLLYTLQSLSYCQAACYCCCSSSSRHHMLIDRWLTCKSPSTWYSSLL